MEILSCSYQFLSELIMAIESGVSSRNYTQDYIHDQNNEWSVFLAQYIFKISNNSLSRGDINKISNPYERAIIDLLLRSFQGEPTLEEFKSLESQYYLAHGKVLDKHLLKLPYLSLIPLFIFLFPAYLILMLGPILMNLIQEMS